MCKVEAVPNEAQARDRRGSFVEGRSRELKGGDSRLAYSFIRLWVVSLVDELGGNQKI
jgi:hypothetical protein